MPGSAARRVLLPLPLGGAYDYSVPAEMAVEPGSFVRVPLGNRSVPAVVWDDGEPSEEPIPEHRLKPIAECYDVPPMRAPLRRLVDWIAAYTLAPPARCCAWRLDRLKRSTRPKRGAAMSRPEAAVDDKARMTPARRRILDVLADACRGRRRALALEAGCSGGVVRGMVEAGLVAEVPIAARPRRPVPDWRLPFPTLSPDQAEAAETISDAVRAQRYECFLLDGVTGSGKTEVYFKADRRGAGGRGARCWYCCPRSASARNGISASSGNSVARPRAGIPMSAAPNAGRSGATLPRARRGSWSARARRCSCLSAISA